MSDVGNEFRRHGFLPLETCTMSAVAGTIPAPGNSPLSRTASASVSRRVSPARDALEKRRSPSAMAEMRNDLRRFIDVLLVRKFTASTLPLLPTQSQNAIESGTGPASSSAPLRADDPRLGILHGPQCFIPRCVLVAIPRGPADVKIGIRRSSKHDPRTRISHRGREAAMLRIKRPKHHPVWPYGNRRACLIEGRVVAMLRGPAEHITQSR